MAEENQTARLERDMTRSEIDAASDNLNVDWGWVDCGHRGMATTLWLRLYLWLRIIGRVNQADCRTGPLLAWNICAGIYPWHEAIKSMGIVDDRR